MALQDFKARHNADQDGNPAGGTSEATGILIEWQNGPLGKLGTTERKEPNGAFVETVIAIAKDRIEYYQKAAAGKFACSENAKAIEHLQHALNILGTRTKKREMAGVEGTHGQRPGEEGTGLAAGAPTPGAEARAEETQGQAAQDAARSGAEGGGDAGSGSDN
ncbi:MAG: hypothetical protein MOGMAGMI_02321 [Candidatus Omnitrophica bacterium]|nr:hypothetical protein [Candidatus Omnitrophota bacterium]